MEKFEVNVEEEEEGEGEGELEEDEEAEGSAAAEDEAVEEEEDVGESMTEVERGATVEVEGEACSVDEKVVCTTWTFLVVREKVVRALFDVVGEADDAGVEVRSAEDFGLTKASAVGVEIVEEEGTVVVVVSEEEGEGEVEARLF